MVHGAKDFDCLSGFSLTCLSCLYQRDFRNIANTELSYWEDCSKRNAFFISQIVTQTAFSPKLHRCLCTVTLGTLIMPLAAAAAAAKSLQSCPTLCDPVDGSPPGSPVPGILQARILEWFAISSSNAQKWKVKVKSRPHGLQPTRLLRPWDFPGKSTGVGCHCLLRYCLLLFSKYAHSNLTFSGGWNFLTRKVFYFIPDTKIENVNILGKRNW